MKTTTSKLMIAARSVQNTEEGNKRNSRIKGGSVMRNSVNQSTMFSIGLLVVALLAVAFPLHSAAQPFFNGFEIDTSGWDAATRVSSGTDGIGSSSGAFHAEAQTAPADSTSDTFTHWGGYSSVFPTQGYVTELDIYLDVGGGFANDTRFDFSSAINGPDGNHRRDFVFNAGFYNDSDLTGTGDRFVISASNNATRSGAFPKDAGRSPLTIAVGGWYKFRHHFYDQGAGVLAVDLSILDSTGAVLKTWTLSDPTDIIGTTVGGNRYGWFVINEFSVLAFDNTYRYDIGTPQAAPKITVAPFTFAGRGSGKTTGVKPAEAKWVKIGGDFQLLLAKNVPTTDVAAAGAQIQGVEGLSTTGLTIGFKVESGVCGAGSPRFNVTLMNGSVVFLGCTYGNDGSGNVSFTAGNSYGGNLFPNGEIIQSISIIVDETGTSYLDDIFIGASVVGDPGASQ